jgi:hypothetical protein
LQGCTALSQGRPPGAFATTIAFAATKRRQASIGLRQERVLLPGIETNGVKTMNSTSTADTANSFFQVLTIAMVGLFILAKVAQFVVNNIA